MYGICSVCRMSTGTRHARLMDETHRVVSGLSNVMGMSMTAVLHVAVIRLDYFRPEMVRRIASGRYKKMNIRTALRMVMRDPGES
jgi:hypothetical protein